jgi:hypothetical protein
LLNFIGERSLVLKVADVARKVLSAVALIEHDMMDLRNDGGSVGTSLVTNGAPSQQHFSTTSVKASKQPLFFIYRHSPGARDDGCSCCACSDSYIHGQNNEKHPNRRKIAKCLDARSYRPGRVYSVIWRQKRTVGGSIRTVRSKVDTMIVAAAAC